MNVNYTHCFSVTDKNTNKTFNIDQTRLDTLEKDLLITHAHADHITNTPQKAITNKITKEFIDVVLPKNKINFSEIEQNKTTDLTDRIKVTALNAGHTLGSSMYYFESPNRSLLYTGDFATKNSLLLKGAEPISADTLIIESTFGRENFIFPERQEIYQDFAEMLAKDIQQDKLIVVGAYALGKSQEVIKFINEYLGITPLVTQNISDINKVYQENEIDLGNYKTLNGNIREANIIVVPPNLINRDVIKTMEHQANKKISTYIITGWDFYKGSTCVPISDHADFNDILEFVTEVNPKQVYCTHGFHKDLAYLLRKKLKVNAKSVSDIFKKNILDYVE